MLRHKDQPVTQGQMEGLLNSQISKQLKKHWVTWAKESSAVSKNQEGSAT
jgi:hypothetical protein